MRSRRRATHGNVAKRLVGGDHRRPNVAGSIGLSRNARLERSQSELGTRCSYATATGG
jgi:hypothetical protein